MFLIWYMQDSPGLFATPLPNIRPDLAVLSSQVKLFTSDEFVNGSLPIWFSLF